MIKSLKAHNFLSLGDVSVDFIEGVTLINGFNYDDNTSEGSGKSSLLNAISWCLYGDVPKALKVSDIIKDGKKSCSVTVELVNGDSIHRSRNPNVVFISTRKGEVKGKDLKDTQNIINNYLGMSFDSYCKAVYFAQDYAKNFLLCTNEEKAKILSEVQNLSRFDSARTEAASRSRSLATKMENTKQQLALTEKRIEDQSHDIQNYTNIINDFNNKKKEDLESIEALISQEKDLIAEQEKQAIQLSAVLAEMPEVSEAQMEELGTEIDKLVAKKAEYESQKKYKESLQHQIAKLQEEGQLIETTAEECHYCGSALGLEKMQEKQARLQEIITELNNLRREEQQIILVKPVDVDDLIEKNRAVARKAKETNKEKAEIESKLQTIDFTVKQHYANLDRYKSEYENKFRSSAETLITAQAEIQERLQKYKESQKELNSNLDSYVKDFGDYQLLAGAFKTVKVHVFASLLKEINKKANVYLQELFDQNASITMTTSEDFKKVEVQIMLDDNERSIAQLSGGQLKRFQFAVDMAVSESVFSRTKNFNYRIFDEYFKNLSEASMEKILKVLERQPGMTLLIEHNSVFKQMTHSTIKVELRNGETRIA